jgi:spermidine synthase
MEFSLYLARTALLVHLSASLAGTVARNAPARPAILCRCYVGGLLAIGFASVDQRSRRTSARTLAERYRRAGRFATRYWTPQLQVGVFALPRFIAELAAGKTAEP